jgi:hypothetical protein
MMRAHEQLGDVELEAPPSVGTHDELGPPAHHDLFCHISNGGDNRTAYCGAPADGTITCGLYNGESVCPSCGLPMCIRCTTMSSLHERLVDDEEGSQ